MITSPLGVKTYTSVLGIGKAVFILFIVETLLALLQVNILGKNHLPWIIIVYTVVDVINILFAEKKSKKYAKLVELVANVFIIIIYLSMGLLLV